MEEEFHYCIGFRWDESDPTHIGTYAYGTQVFRGTQESANEMLEFVQSRNSDHTYRIYRLVELENV